MEKEFPKNFPLDLDSVDEQSMECMLEEFAKVIRFFKSEIDSWKEKYDEISEKLEYLDDFYCEVRDMMDS
jgi:hypothetical protein